MLDKESTSLGSDRNSKERGRFLKGIEDDRAIKIMMEVVGKYPQCASADDAIYSIIIHKYNAYIKMRKRSDKWRSFGNVYFQEAKDWFEKLITYYPSSPYIKIIREQTNVDNK